MALSYGPYAPRTTWTRAWLSASQKLGISWRSFSKSQVGWRAQMASRPFCRAKRYFSIRPRTAPYCSYTSSREIVAFPCQRLSAPAVETGTNAS